MNTYETVTEQLRQLKAIMRRNALKKNEARQQDPHQGQGRVLAVLKLTPEISQRDLSFLLDMSKQSLAELLAKLENKGYITREAYAEDKRRMKVSLTELGKNAAAELDEKKNEAYDFLDCLNEDELSSFSNYLTRIIDNYKEKYPEADLDKRPEKNQGHGPCSPMGRAPWEGGGMPPRKPDGRAPWEEGGRPPRRPDGRAPWEEGGRLPHRPDGRAPWEEGGRPPHRPDGRAPWEDEHQRDFNWPVPPNRNHDRFRNDTH